MTEEILYTTNNYTIFPNYTAEDGPCYEIVNNKTNIAEVQLNILPEAIEICDHLDSKLTELLPEESPLKLIQ